MQEYLDHIKGRADEALWEKVITSLSETMVPNVISANDFSDLIERTSNIDNFILLCQSFYRYSKSQPDASSVYELFASHVDASPNNIDDWADSLRDFYKWLDENDKTSDLKTMLGYLICCAASPENKDTKQSLSSLFSQMINEYGFEAAKDKF